MEKREYQDLLYKTMSKEGPEAMSRVYQSLSEDDQKQMANEMIYLLDWMWQKNKSYALERFGSKYVQDAMPGFNLTSHPDLDDLPDSEEIEEPKPAKKPGRKSGKNKKNILNSPGLERKIVEHDPVGINCPQCGKPMVSDGFRDVQRLVWIPGKWMLIIDRYPNMICPDCTDDNGNHLSFCEAEANPNLFEGSIVSAEVIARIAYYTYTGAIPLHRQAGMYQLEGIDISKQTEVNWLDLAYDNYLEPAVNVMEKDFPTLKGIHLDESTHKSVKNRKVRCTNYEIIGCSGRGEEK